MQISFIRFPYVSGQQHPDDRFSGLYLGWNDWEELFVKALGVPEEPYVESDEPWDIRDERQRKRFLERLTELGYPLLGRFHDVYFDAFYMPEEVQGLLEECERVRAQFPPEEVPSAINKLLYACYEARRDDLGIKLSGGQ